MRPVEWDIVLKLLEIVARQDGKIRPIELENIALAEGVFKSKTTGTPLAHSPRFYYRKALEHLGFVENISGKYFISKSPPILELISKRATIDSNKKRIIAELIVNNEDCKKNFVSLFLLDDKCKLEEIQNKSAYVIAKSYSIEHKQSSAKRSLKPIMLTSPLLDKNISIDTPDRIHAIFWGIRRWLLDVEAIDEIITSPKAGRVIYFVNPSIGEQLLLLEFKRFLRRYFTPNRDWIKIYLPDFYEYIIFNSQMRARTSVIKNFLVNFINENKSSVIPIPISGTMLNAEVKFEKQDAAFKRSFLNFHNIGYVAYLNINKTLI